MNLKEKQELQSQFEQEILLTQLEIQDETFKNISQEIHDNIGQTLSLAKLNLNTINLDEKSKANIKIDDCKTLVSQAISDLRDLAKSLNSEAVFSQGLKNALQFELDRVAKTGAFDTEFRYSEPRIVLDSKKELIVFRIIQEGLNNIIKHSKASQIVLEVIYRDDALEFTLLDNGVGLFPSSECPNPSRGSGIINMKNRARLLGGSLEMNSDPANGTMLRLLIPYN